MQKSDFKSTSHCLSHSYPPSKCKCNKWVLHLSDVAMHVDAYPPQPFLHRAVGVCWNDRYSVVLNVILSFRVDFTFYFRTFIWTSHCAVALLQWHSTVLTFFFFQLWYSRLIALWTLNSLKFVEKNFSCSTIRHFHLIFFSFFSPYSQIISK